MTLYVSQGPLVGVRRPTDADRDEFLAMVVSNRDLHFPWVAPPSTPEKYSLYLQTRQAPTFDGFVICELTSSRIVGVVNLGCIIRGFLDSAFLGYYGSTEFAGKGYMTQGVNLVASVAFTQLGLHRLEANIQPENKASIALARRCRFRKEGFSPKYLRVFDEWRDHERWALRSDQDDQDDHAAPSVQQVR